MSQKGFNTQFRKLYLMTNHYFACNAAFPAFERVFHDRAWRAQRSRARQDERRVCRSSARDQGRARGLQLLEGLVVARQVDRPQGCCVFFVAVSGECTMTYLRYSEDAWAQALVRTL